MPMYVTVNEFKQAPTGIDCSTLDQTKLGNANAQDAALSNVLRRASAWVDNICQQTLQATTDTETKEVHIGRDGRLAIHPDNVPIVSVSTVGYRTSPDQGYTTVDSNNIQVLDSWFTVYYINTGYFSPALAIQFPEFGYQDPLFRQRLSEMPMTVQYTYTNGYANSVLSANVLANANTITVDDATGFVNGGKFTIFDADFEENCVINSVSGNTITLTSPLLFGHNKGVAASALPADVKQATILLAGVLIRERGSVALTMGETNIGGVNSDFVKQDDVGLAKSLLKKYKRVVTS